MTVTNEKAHDFYRYKDHMVEPKGCFEEGKCCYWVSLKGKAEMWDEQRESCYSGRYAECTGWSLVQRGAWLISGILCIPTKLFFAGCGTAAAVCCCGCGLFYGACGCARSVVCCCDENSQKTQTAALACLGIGGVCCCIGGCSCVECMEEAAVTVPSVILPECTLGLNVLGCLHKQAKLVEDLNKKPNELMAALRK